MEKGETNEARKKLTDKWVAKLEREYKLKSEIQIRTVFICIWATNYKQVQPLFKIPIKKSLIYYACINYKVYNLIACSLVFSFNLCMKCGVR